MLYTLDKYLFQSGTELEAWLGYYDIFASIALVVFGMIWFMSGQMISTWVWAWYKRSPIGIRYREDGKVEFKVPEIDSAQPKMWEFDKGSSAVQVRKPAMMTGPHNIMMMLTTDDFPSGIGPVEAMGKRWYQPEEMFEGYVINGAVHEAIEPTEADGKLLNEMETKLGGELEEEERSTLETEYAALLYQVNNWEKRELYVRYPEHGINPKEFVEHNPVNTSPELQASFARRKEIQAKMDVEKRQDSWFAFSQAAPALVPLLLIIFIGWTYISQHNVGMAGYADAQSCQTKYVELMESRNLEPLGADAPKPGGKKPVQKGTGGSVK